MSELAAIDNSENSSPVRLKISSKRQITIPVDVFRRKGFSEYALLTETADGFTIQPMELTSDDEQLTLALLKYLVEHGYVGDELIQKYEELKPKFASFYKAIESSEKDITEGRLVDFDDMQAELREKYGL